MTFRFIRRTGWFLIEIGDDWLWKWISEISDGF